MGRQHFAGDYAVNGIGNGFDPVVGGWQTAGIVTMSSGKYVCITTNAKATGYQYPACTPRANIVGNSMPFRQNQYEWFNPAAYSVPSPYVYSNSAPYSVQSPGSFAWDAALHKQTRITERIGSQIRLEAFDVLEPCESFEFADKYQ